MTSRTSRWAAARTLLWLATLLAPCLAVEAGEDPRAERGFSPETAFQVGEIDTVNLFNGNLVLQLPIGQSYTLDGGMSYGLNLIYNSSVWDTDTVPNPAHTGEPCGAGVPGLPRCEPEDLTYPRPNLFSNAGFGWSLSLGELHPPAEGDFPPPPPPDDYGIVVSVAAADADPPLNPIIHVDTDFGESSTCTPTVTCEHASDTVFVATISIQSGFEHFRGWDGDCYNPATEMDQTINVTVEVEAYVCVGRFAAEDTEFYTLDITPLGEGGWVESIPYPPGIQCGPQNNDDCSQQYAETDSIHLTSLWDDGYRLVNWGACSLDSHEGQPKTLPGFSLDEDRYCDVLFVRCGIEDPPPGFPKDDGPEPSAGPSCEEELPLYLEITGSGGGTVTAYLPHIPPLTKPHGAGNDVSDDALYTWASRVDVVAEPDEDSTFEGWYFLSDPADPLNPPARCVPDPGNPREAQAFLFHESGCQAIFEDVPETHGIVRVFRTGNGAGWVDDDSGEIFCGDDCEGSYPEGSTVRLTAHESHELSRFNAWTGTGCNPVPGDRYSTDVSVVVSTPRECTAEFLQINPSEYELTVTATSGDGAGLGRVTSSPGSIYCETGTGGICEEEFPALTTVDLTATATFGEFHKWDNNSDCAPYGFNPLATVYMDDHRSCEALFRDCSAGGCGPDLVQLTVQFIGDGVGAIDFGLGDPCWGPEDCGRSFGIGQSVDLEAIEDLADFQGWGGDCGFMGGDPDPAPFDIQDHMTCTAAFGSPLDDYALVLVKDRLSGADGRVWSDPDGPGTIDCDVGCPGETGFFVELTTVTLYAQADDSSVFAGWSGDCDSAGEVVMTDDPRNCTAHFRPLYELNVTVGEWGLVTSSPGDIYCLPGGGGTCSDLFEFESWVILVATPDDENHEFLAWTGACSGQTASADVQILADPTSCSASFRECPGTCADGGTLTIGTSSHGTVVSDDGGINCGSDCDETYPSIFWVHLEAIPDEGYTFDVWTGATCNLQEMDDPTPTFLMGPVDRTCVPQYEVGPVEEFELTVDLAGQGTGTVVNVFGAINCPGVCDETLEDGDQVRLEPTPDPDQRFGGWNAGCPGSGDIRSFNIGDDEDCIATFEPADTYEVTITMNAGSVFITPPGTTCTETCTEPGYEPETAVTVIADDYTEPGGAEMVFKWWNENFDCAEDPLDRTAYLTMDGDKECRPVYGPGCQFNCDESTEGSQDPWEEPHLVNRTPLWTYVSSDGAKHTFYDDFDTGSSDGADHVFYSRDNTFMRLTLNNTNPDSATGATIEMPDGSRHLFSKHEPANDPWLEAPTWLLDRMENIYSTGVDVLYTQDLWELADGEGRHHYVHFGQSGFEELGRQVSQVDLQVFGGERALYDFQYDAVDLPWCYRNQLFEEVWPPRPDSTFPLLAAIDMPEGVTYSATGYADTFPDGECTADGVPGAIQGLNLPTEGAIEWDYGHWKLPSQARPYQTIAAGVRERRFIGRDGGVDGRWTYVAESQPIDPPWGFYNGIDHYPTESWTHVALEGIVGASHCTKHYFSSDNSTGREWQGLPFSPSNPVSDLYLSTEVFAGADSSGFCTGAFERSTAVRYRHDGGTGTVHGEHHNPFTDTNRRIEASQTTFVDDGNRKARTDNSGYTGMGQFETVSASGWSGALRQEFTDYLLTDEPAPGERWILGLYDTQSVSENGDTATTVSSFNPDTGFLECRRTLSGTNAPAVAASFIDDGLGNVSREEWALGSCGASPDYAIDHTYQAGVLESSQYEGVTFKSYDALIDASTGLAVRTFATDGLATQYVYDELGRLESVDPPGEDARVEYDYDVASGSTPAQVNMSWKKTDGTVRKTRRLEFDGLGRVEKEGVSRPGGQLAFRVFEYNALGWQLSQSEWGMPNPSSHKTEFEDFDPFGRPRLVTAPDTSETDFVYLGVRRMERSSEVETTAGPQAAEYVEIKDAFGRLIRVEEPGSGGLDADYSYDVGNRFSGVALSGADGDQSRAFDYDHRGFLLSETHPEKNNTAVEYDGHDARGHAASQTDGLVTLTFDYDAAERLRTVSNGGVIKEFIYDGAASGGAGKLHQGIRHNDLSGAPGSLGVGADLVVTETYDYDGNDGRVKSRMTNINFGGSSYAGTMTLEFDELGLPSQETYPDCPGCGSAPTPAVNYFYNNGHLSIVRGKDFSGQSYDFSKGISYHPNGLMSVLTHGNSGGNVKDRQFINSANGMARPNRLYASVGTPGQALWDSGTYGYDGFGNIKTIGSDSFDYDKTSRLTRAVLDGMPDRPYGYDSFGNLTSLDGRSWPTSTTTNRVSAFTYDPRGNVQSSPDFGSLEYDAISMPVSRLTGGDEAWFAYTADDERVWTGRIDSGVATQKLSLRGLDGKVRRELSRKPGSKKGIAWVKDYFYRGGPLLASQAAGGEVRHYHLDHLGTPRAISDDTGTAVSLHKYWPYGEEITDPLESDNVMQFTGHERDGMGSPTSNADDLDYMHARYYTPWAGRFLSIDPAGGSAKPTMPQSWNRYGYGLGNPVKYVDPDGEEVTLSRNLEPALRLALRSSDFVRQIRFLDNKPSSLVNFRFVLDPNSPASGTEARAEFRLILDKKIEDGGTVFGTRGTAYIPSKGTTIEERAKLIAHEVAHQFEFVKSGLPPSKIPGARETSAGWTTPFAKATDKIFSSQLSNYLIFEDAAGQAAEARRKAKRDEWIKELLE